MKRTALKRKTRLRSRGKGSRFPKTMRKDFRAWIREQCCMLAEVNPGHTCEGVGDRQSVEPAHVKTWGSSGLDVGNIVPLCPAAHDLQEGATKEFERRFRVNLTVAAEQYWRAFESENGVTL